MKRYVNGVSDFKITALFFNCISIIVIVVRLVFYKPSEELSGVIAMIISLSLCSLFLDLIIIFLRNEFYTTYYNDEIIVQKFFWNKKIILLKNIKQIIIIKNTIVLLEDIVDICCFEIKNGKLLNYLSKNINILIGKSDSILILISGSEYLKFDLINPTNQIKERLNKIFDK